MNQYPTDIEFKYPWRKYQQRVLDELDKHLSDQHLHVIAPPGSGKTVLGLEVAIRLNQPTLILAPTIAIRNQWILRFCELFLQTAITPDWISRDIRNPKFMTVVTYQGLHAACNNLRIKEKNKEKDENIDEYLNNVSTHSNLNNIAKGLLAQNIKTIVVDEAHHLKNEWWQTLTKIKEKLNPIIVGLTATPPYDVTPLEWHRYLELNGPVDTEISVPELVIEGDLCPHQDYVHFTLPTEKETEGILEFRKNIDKLFHEIKKDEILVRAIENHPIWINPLENLDWIYTNLSYYSASLIFLNANGKEIPKSHLEIIGGRKFKIPKLDYEWLETLLEFYIYNGKENFKVFKEHQEALENRLRHYGAIERRQIDFSYNKRLTGLISTSISKLQGIQEIVNFEYKNLKENLRLVILTDFIRKEFLTNSSENNLELNKIGVMPIFEKLRRENTDRKKIGVLTGSIVIIPKSAYSAFEIEFKKQGISNLNISSIPYDSDYILIHRTDHIKNHIVHIITQIFQQGEIEVLIGTKSLLGEGWDAPAINTLILASFVGSFVLSNQMRGRAIRTENGNPDKTGNIWHLACIDPTSTTGGDDLEVLQRRFKSFLGVSFEEDAGIENGIGRLKVSGKLSHPQDIRNKNEDMFLFAGDRENLKLRWDQALAKGVNLVEEIEIPFPEEREYKPLQALYLRKTIANLMATLGSALFGFGIDSLQALSRALKNMRTMQDVYAFLSIIGILGIVIFGRRTLKALRLYFKYRDISKDIHQIGDALLNSLIKINIIQTDISKLKVETSMDNHGTVFCHLEGGTTFEKSTFINSLQEIIVPIDNPRYVIIRKSRLILFITQKDYHSVPEIFGRNKTLATYFKQQWQQYVGRCDLIFTRNIQGRKLLIKSRINSLATQLEDKVEHRNRWR